MGIVLQCDAIHSYLATHTHTAAAADHIALLESAPLVPAALCAGVSFPVLFFRIATKRPVCRRQKRCLRELCANRPNPTAWWSTGNANVSSNLTHRALEQPPTHNHESSKNLGNFGCDPLAPNLPCAHVSAKLQDFLHRCLTPTPVECPTGVVHEVETSRAEARSCAASHSLSSSLSPFSLIPLTFRNRPLCLRASHPVEGGLLLFAHENHVPTAPGLSSCR